MMYKRISLKLKLLTTTTTTSVKVKPHNSNIVVRYYFERGF